MRSALIHRLETSIVALFVASATVSAVSEVPLGFQEEKTANLTGSWTLNKDLSDDPAKALENLQAERRGGFGGGGRMPGGMGGRGGGMGGGRSGMDPEEMREMRTRMSRATESPAKLTITHGDGSITFSEGAGRSQTLTTNNKKEKKTFDNQTVEIKTKWDHGRLVKETSLGDGMTLTETYSLDPETRRLNVQLKFTNSRMPRPLTLRRVYDGETAR